MLIRVLSHPLKYDGTQLSSLWAFRQFKLQGDSIVCFSGPCDVKLSEMVDLADVIHNSPIFSEDMLHFIIEHFDMDLEKTIIRQRLLMALIKEMLESKTGARLVRRGDDIYQAGNKLSVSIATTSPVSTMIHTGLNISSNNTPVPTIGLIDLGLLKEDILHIGQEIAQAYLEETSGIKLARCKVRGVG